MRIIIILLLVSLCCLVGAKYLPDDSGSRSITRHGRSTRDNLDNASESQSNESHEDDNDDDDDNDDNDSLELKRQQQIAKLERKRQEEQRKLQEKREKEERKRQEELEKEQRKREKIQAKFEEEKRKLEVKLEKEERKRKDKIEKEERKRIEKLAEEDRKHQEKLAKEERKKQENFNKKLESLAKETATLENEPINSAESEEDLDFEDIWKNYIYEKYGLTQTSTDIAKNAAVNRYLQEELGLNANSTKSEYRQAVLQLVQTKLAVQQPSSSSQGGFKNYLTSHVNAAYIQKLQTEIETKISELDNDTALLQNVSLPWVPQARYAIEQKKTILTSIAQYLSDVLPNWITGNNSSSNVDSSNANTISDPSSNVGSVQGIDGTPNSDSNNLLILDEVSTDSNSNIGAVSTQSAPVDQGTGSTLASNSVDSSNSISIESASSTVSEGSTSNPAINSQVDIASNNSGQNEITINNADPSSVTSTGFETFEGSTSNPAINSEVDIASNNAGQNEITINNADPSSVTSTGFDTFEGSTSNPAINSQVDIASNNAGQNEITINNADPSSVTSTGFDNSSDSASLNNQSVAPTNNISNGAETSPISVSSATDSNVVVAVDPAAASLPSGVIDSTTVGVSDLSVSNTLIPSPTNIDVLATSVTINPSNNGESPISVTSVIDSNVVVPVDPISNVASGAAGSVTSNTPEVSVFSTLVPSATNIDVPASGDAVGTSNNNIGAPAIEGTISNNFGNDAITTDVVTANGSETVPVDIANDSSVSNSALSGFEPTGDVSSSNNNISNGQSLTDSLNTATTTAIEGVTLVENSQGAGAETSITGTEIATQSVNNVASIDTAVLGNSDSNVTQETEGLIPVATTSVNDSINTASTGSATTNIITDGTQGDTNTDIPFVDTSVNSASSASPASNAVANTSTVGLVTADTSDFIPSLIESSTASQLTDTVNINTVENTVNTDSTKNEFSPTGVVDAVPATNIVGENTVNTATAETPVNNAVDATSSPILQVSDDAFTSSAITVDNSVSSTVLDSSLTSSSDPTNIASEIISSANSGTTDSTGVEAAPIADSTVDAILSVTDSSITTQDLLSSNNILSDSTTTATETVNENGVNVVHIDNSINNVLESITTAAPVAYTELIGTETSTITGGETTAEVTATNEGAVPVVVPIETHVEAIDVANFTNDTTITEGNNVNTQDAVVTVTEVNLGEINGGVTPSSVVSIAITETTDISPISNDTTAVEKDISINPIDYAPSTHVPETIVTEVVASEAPVNIADILTATEQSPVEASVGTLNENVNTVTASETLVTSTDSLSVTDSPIIPPTGIDFTVVNVTDLGLGSANGSTVSYINTDPTDVSVNNTPVLSINTITTSEPALGIQPPSVGSETVEKANEIKPLVAQDNAPIPTALPEEAGASLLEVTQQ